MHSLDRCASKQSTSRAAGGTRSTRTMTSNASGLRCNAAKPTVYKVRSRTPRFPAPLAEPASFGNQSAHLEILEWDAPRRPHAAAFENAHAAGPYASLQNQASRCKWNTRQKACQTTIANQHPVATGQPDGENSPS